MIGATATLLPLRLFAIRRIGRGDRRDVRARVTPRHHHLAGIGRLVDRRGPRLPIALGLLVTAPLIAALPLPASALGLAVLTVIALGGP